MDFQPKTANLQGGDTHKTPNLANHGKHTEGKTPPHVNPSQSTKSRNITPNLRTARPPPTHSLQSLPITAYHGNPSQSFLTKIPISSKRCLLSFQTRRDLSETFVVQCVSRVTNLRCP